MADEPPWYQSSRGIAVVGVYAVLTLLALGVSTGPDPLNESVLVGNVSSLTEPSATVPPVVYLYAFLGAMAYAFTSVVAKFERSVKGVVRVGLRALAALPLAAGVFLLAGAMNLPTGSGSLVAGLAFLVGLYVNLTLKALGGLADRLYGRVPGDGTGGGEEGSSSGASGDAGGSDGDASAKAGDGTRADAGGAGEGERATGDRG